MLRATVRTISNHSWCNPGRSFIHGGFIEGETFYYDGNWTAEDNTMYRYHPEDDTPKTETIDLSECEIVRTWESEN